jgi:pimeloyl-ACP methyl ester carboxylesterase
LHNANVSASTNSGPSYSLLDPNPSLIDIDGKLINDINLAANLTTHRSGTIADGISKLILIVESKSSLQFSIKDTSPDNTTNGTLSSLKQPSKDDNKSSSTAKDSPDNISNGKSVVAAVYTPPESFNQVMGSYRTINVNVSDPNNSASTLFEIPIQLYRPPIVLVHGLWMNSDNAWVATKFADSLRCYGFHYTFADYEEHNSETFDPCDNKVFGNYGIDSIRNAVHKILGEYRYFSIAASQVDLIAHSMGGLMARGFVQQPDYKGKENYMKGSIHRLITIGTPHFGGPLSEFLYEHIDDWYFCDGIKPNRCRTGKIEPKKLRTIYSEGRIPIDKGAIEALIPNSIAYSHLHQTNVKSYAIAGSYRRNATKSYDSQESYYKAVVGSDDFNLDKDAFEDCDNDLLVSITSQLGGLPEQIRHLNSNNIPNQSAVYSDTVHEKFYIKDYDGVFSETNSPHVQKDVIKLLSYSDSDKFADAIGIDLSNGSSK